MNNDFDPEPWILGAAAAAIVLTLVARAIRIWDDEA